MLAMLLELGAISFYFYPTLPGQLFAAEDPKPQQPDSKRRVDSQLVKAQKNKENVNDKRGKANVAKSKRAKKAKGKNDPAHDQPIDKNSAEKMARVLKLLGDKEEGHFLLVLKKSAVRTIAPNTRIPANARRSGNRWTEVIYQVEFLENRQQAAEFLLAFDKFAQKPTKEKARFDWRLVGHYNDLVAAEEKLEEVKENANRQSVTRRPRTDIAMKFFYKDGAPKPFQGPQKNKNKQ